MSVVSVREVKNNIKKHKNIMDSQNKGSHMSFGGGFEPIDKALRVGPCMKKLAKRKRIETIKMNEILDRLQPTQISQETMNILLLTER